jgi:hypothetical protein
MGLKTLWAALFMGLLMLVAVRMDLPSHVQWGPAVAGAEKSKEAGIVLEFGRHHH